METLYRTYQLPWEMAQDQDDRFTKLLQRVILAVLVLCVIVPWLPVFEPDPSEIKEVPPRFAKLLLEKAPPPPPPPPVEKKVVEDKPLPEKAEKVVENKPEPVETPKPKEEVREAASQAGLLPFAEQLAELRDSSLDNVMGNNDLNESAGEAARTERSVIASKAGQGSGGIVTSGMSRDTGGGGLQGRGTTRVAAPVALADSGPKVKKGGAGPSRSREEIELVFEKNKGAIFALYNRALRRNPTLQGKLVLRLTISPSGQVTDCVIDSSELNDPEMERKLVQRVKLFRFDAKDVATVTTTKPIDFFPA